MLENAHAFVYDMSSQLDENRDNTLSSMAMADKFCVTQIHELGELVDGLKNGKSTHQQVVDKWVQTYRMIVRTYNLDDKCGFQAAALFDQFGILANTVMSTYAGIGGEYMVLPMERTVSLDPNFDLFIQTRSLPECIMDINLRKKELCDKIFGSDSHMMPPTQLDMNVGTTEPPIWDCSRQVMPPSGKGWLGSSAQELAFAPTSCQSFSSSSAAADAAAAKEDEKEKSEFIGLDGKPLRITVHKPITFEELDSKTEAALKKQIYELGKLIRTFGHSVIDAKTHEPYIQAVKEWKRIYNEVLVAFNVTDQCHHYSQDFFAQFGIVTERMNTNVLPYEPAMGTLTNSDVMCNNGTYYVNYLLHIAAEMYRFREVDGEGQIQKYCYDDIDYTMPIDDSNSTDMGMGKWVPLDMSLCKAMTAAFPSDLTLEPETVLVEEGNTANGGDEAKLVPFPSLTEEGDYVESDGTEFSKHADAKYSSKTDDIQPFPSLLDDHKSVEFDRNDFLKSVDTSLNWKIQFGIE